MSKTAEIVVNQSLLLSFDGRAHKSSVRIKKLLWKTKTFNLQNKQIIFEEN